jgi:V/A-type H+/Na+-transporting ATPase subunit C
MGSIADFAAVNTKIKVLERSLLGKDQLRKLIESGSYVDAFRLLKENTGYGKALKGFSEGNVHRGDLEIILQKDYIEKYTKLVHYLQGNYKALFKIFYMRFEIEDIKVILRGKYLGKSVEEIKKLIIYESSMSGIDYKLLIEARDIEGTVDKLQETIYYKHIQHLIKDTMKEGLFRVEMALDFVYFIALRRFIKKLDNENKEVVKAYKGIQADLLNIQWIFRGKKYYKLQPEELFNYTIYDGARLNKDQLKKLCYSKNMSEFYDMVQSLPYGELFSKCRYKEYLLEREILYYQKHIFESMKRANKMNISAVIAFLELSLIECRDIISIVENKRYNNENEETLNYITATL